MHPLARAFFFIVAARGRVQKGAWEAGEERCQRKTSASRKDMLLSEGKLEGGGWVHQNTGGTQVVIFRLWST